MLPIAPELPVDAGVPVYTTPGSRAIEVKKLRDFKEMLASCVPETSAEFSALEVCSGVASAVTVTCWVRPPTSSAIAPRSRVSSGVTAMSVRSEEHTSELQSLRHLVCRLLL